LKTSITTEDKEDLLGSIRRLYVDEYKTTQSIADELGVARHNVRDIVNKHRLSLERKCMVCTALLTSSRQRLYCSRECGDERTGRALRKKKRMQERELRETKVKDLFLKGLEYGEIATSLGITTPMVSYIIKGKDWKRKCPQCGKIVEKRKKVYCSPACKRKPLPQSRIKQKHGDDFGRKLYHLMVEKGYSASQIAPKLGFHESTIEKFAVSFNIVARRKCAVCGKGGERFKGTAAKYCSMKCRERRNSYEAWKKYAVKRLQKLTLQDLEKLRQQLESAEIVGKRGSEKMVITIKFQKIGDYRDLVNKEINSRQLLNNGKT